MTCPSFVVVLPAIDPQLAEQCVRSMDVTLRDRTVLVDNTPTGEIAAAANYAVACTQAERRNLGVPASWNIGLRATDGFDADYLIILSQSISFGSSGGLDFLAELDSRKPPVLMHSQHGWKLLAIARRTWETVGQFDTIFTPGYREDGDYLWRMHLAGLPSPRANFGEVDQINVDATSAGDAQALLRGHVRVDFGDNLRKYLAKWNGETGEERWANPYGDVRLDWTHVGPQPERPT